MRRRKILVSAYACEPGLGSEPGIGWNWVREIARRHDVWLLTRANNVAKIEARAAQEELLALRVIGFDLPAWMRCWKRGERGAVAYFYLWQLALGLRARALDRRIGFDIVHHVTFASSWIPSGLAFVPKPFVWGPIGRHPRVPDRFIERSNWRLRLGEVAKTLAKRACELCDPLLALTRARADLILRIGTDSSTPPPSPESARTLAFLACGTERTDLPQARFERSADFDVLFAGRLVDLKGARLALEAFAVLAASSARARMTFVGGGECRAALEQRVSALGLGQRVEILGPRPRVEVLARMRRSDVFLFPSFEGAGMVVVEAMAAGNPVVCLDLGGPGEMVGRERGLRVPVAATFEATARALGAALLRLHGDEALRRGCAERAARWALENATWQAKGEKLDGLYALAELHHAEAA